MLNNFHSIQTIIDKFPVALNAFTRVLANLDLRPLK